MNRLKRFLSLLLPPQLEQSGRDSSGLALSSSRGGFGDEEVFDLSTVSAVGNGRPEAPESTLRTRTEGRDLIEATDQLIDGRGTRGTSLVAGSFGASTPLASQNVSLSSQSIIDVTDSISRRFEDILEREFTHWRPIPMTVPISGRNPASLLMESLAKEAVNSPQRDSQESLRLREVIAAYRAALATYEDQYLSSYEVDARLNYALALLAMSDLCSKPPESKSPVDLSPLDESANVEIAGQDQTKLRTHQTGVLGPIERPIVSAIVGREDLLDAPRQRGRRKPTQMHVRALIDTGATDTVIDVSVVKELGLQPVSADALHHPGRKDPVIAKRYQIWLEIENFGPKIQIIAFGLTLAAPGVDVLIGIDVLQYGEFVLDRKRGTFYLERYQEGGSVEAIDHRHER